MTPDELVQVALALADELVETCLEYRDNPPQVRCVVCNATAPTPDDFHHDLYCLIDRYAAIQDALIYPPGL